MSFTAGLLEWLSKNPGVVGSSMVAICGILAAWLSFRRYLGVYQTHVSMDFFRRYSDISLRMPDRLRFSKLSTPRVAVGGEVSSDEWRAIARSMIEYGNLCSEEFELHALGRIPDDIWNKWCSGIKENFEAAIWRDAWHMVAVEYASTKEFYMFMQGIVAEAEASEKAKSAIATCAP